MECSGQALENELSAATHLTSKLLKEYEKQRFPLGGDDEVMTSTLQQFSKVIDEDVGSNLSCIHTVTQMLSEIPNVKNAVTYNTYDELRIASAALLLDSEHAWTFVRWNCVYTVGISDKFCCRKI
ncbi:hypothetical protein AB205_0068140 [Aquarana catesbeiana]|uniref:Uncharacterized protein n=1 Tax=Aquarana catesbeiana TaxID=8400 RepID=A0A2G9S1Q7_AQUCT|nr:hypothetical protein AB205_0068140 [Aquarana catesbeiana]